MKNIFKFKKAVYKYSEEFFIVALLTCLFMGIFIYEVQADDSVLGINFSESETSLFGFSSFMAETESDGPELYSFELYGENINIDVLNPTKPLFEVENDSNIVMWDLITNNWIVDLDFESIGAEEGECNNIQNGYASEFFKYTVTDGTDSQNFFSDREFFPRDGDEEKPSQAAIYDLDQDVAGGLIKVEYDPSLSTKAWCAVEAGKYCDVIQITVTGEYRCQFETAFGGNKAGEENLFTRGNNAWWYYFDFAGGNEQDIIAGRDMLAGKIEFYQEDDFEASFKIKLAEGWRLDYGEETVKIQGYYEENLPTSRPAPGQFETYKGEELEDVIDLYDYYVIHLDLINCN